MTITEMQNQLHQLGWEVACINSNQPDGGITWHFVAKRGDQPTPNTAAKSSIAEEDCPMVESDDLLVHSPR